MRSLTLRSLNKLPGRVSHNLPISPVNLWNRRSICITDQKDAIFPVDTPKERMIASLGCPKGDEVSDKKSEVLQGTLDLMVLKTLHALGPLHGFGIARRIEQLSEDVLQLNEGTVYTSLLRLQQQGLIVSNCGASENNRRARFYSITKPGLKQLALETANWERISGVIERVLRVERQG